MCLWKVSTRIGKKLKFRLKESKNAMIRMKKKKKKKNRNLSAQLSSGSVARSSQAKQEGCMGRVAEADDIG